MISAKIVLMSQHAETGTFLTTFALTYPRFIHAEMLTHRIFSRNSSSSRAIPVEKMLENIRKDMAMPLHWRVNQSGMQANTQMSGWKLKLGKFLWKAAGYSAIGFATALSKLNFHKQVVNRILEPWSHITILLSTTDLENFFELRAHKDAQPEI